MNPLNDHLCSQQITLYSFCNESLPSPQCEPHSSDEPRFQNGLPGGVFEGDSFPVVEFSEKSSLDVRPGNDLGVSSCQSSSYCPNRKISLDNPGCLVILWVEDNLLLQKTYESILNTIGVLDFKFISSVGEFDEHVEHLSKYHLIIFDQELGDDRSKGSDLAAKARARKYCPAKLISCSSSPVEKGVFDMMIKKPMSTKKFTETLENFVEFKEAPFLEELSKKEQDRFVKASSGSLVSERVLTTSEPTSSGKNQALALEQTVLDQNQALALEQTVLDQNQASALEPCDSGQRQSSRSSVNENGSCCCLIT